MAAIKCGVVQGPGKSGGGTAQIGWRVPEAEHKYEPVPPPVAAMDDGGLDPLGCETPLQSSRILAGRRDEALHRKQAVRRSDARCADPPLEVADERRQPPPQLVAVPGAEGEGTRRRLEHGG
jgi:hypothetical protein